MKTDAYKPTRIFTLFGDSVEVLLFGRNNGETDWSIVNLKSENDYRVGVYGLIDNIPGRPWHLLAPKPSLFNGCVCGEADLTTSIKAPVLRNDVDGTVIHRPVAIHRGCDADGVEITKNDYLRQYGYWLSSADCPTIIARHKKTGRVIASHAGRDCLVDRKRLTTGQPSRPHESVVDAIIATFKSKNDSSEDLQVFITCGISAINFPHPTEHPKYGVENAKLVEHFKLLGEECVLNPTNEGRLNLPEIIRAQFKQHGVPWECIADDGINTYRDTDRCGEYTWWSNGRGKTPEEKARRNGVLVIPK